MSWSAAIHHWKNLGLALTASLAGSFRTSAQCRVLYWVITGVLAAGTAAMVVFVPHRNPLDDVVNLLMSLLLVSIAATQASPDFSVNSSQIYTVLLLFAVVAAFCVITLPFLEDYAVKRELEMADEEAKSVPTAAVASRSTGAAYLAVDDELGERSPPPPAAIAAWHGETQALDDTAAVETDRPQRQASFEGFFFDL